MISKNLKCQPKLILFLIIVFGFYLRLLYLDAPLVEFYKALQTNVASIARNFYLHNFNIFYPQLDWVDLAPVRLPFPIYPFIVALLYLIFGIQECIGRLVSIFFSLFTAYFIFKLTKKYFHENTAILAVFFYLLSPISIYFGRYYMPEPMMICFSVAGIYYFSQWLDNNKWIFFNLALVSCMMAILIKISNLFYLLFPLLYLAYNKYKFRLFQNLQLWLFAGLIFLVELCWFWHVYHYGLKSGAWEGIKNISLFYNWMKTELLCNFNIFNSDNFYGNMAERFATIILTPIGLTLFIMGIFLPQEDKTGYFIHCWLLGNLIFILVFASGNLIHFYYQLPIIPPASILIATTLSSFSNKKLMNKLMIPVVLILFTFFSLYYILPYYKYIGWDFIRAGRVVDKITPKDALIAADGPFATAVFYYSNRKGIPMWSITPFPEDLERCRRQGANYYVSLYLANFINKTEFGEYMIKNYTVLNATDRFVIFDIRKKKNEATKK